MRRSTLATQVTIAVLCIAAVLAGGMNLVSMLVLLATLEAGALAGQWYGRRLRARMESAPLY